MAPSFKATDLQYDRIARLTVDVDLRRGTRRAPWPEFARFKPWLLMGRRTRKVDLVRRSIAESIVGTPHDPDNVQHGMSNGFSPVLRQGQGLDLPFA